MIDRSSLLQYQKSEQFRAETFRHIGYVCCSPLCLIVLNQLLTGIKFYDRIYTCLLVALILLAFGVKMILESYFMLRAIDEERNNHDE